MPPPSAAVAHYAAQQRQAEAAMILARRQWRTVYGDLDASWAKIVSRLTLIVASAQLGAAKAGAAYVPVVLGEIGDDPQVLGSVNPARWAGVASDGRPLDSLLYSAVVRAKVAIGNGETEQAAVQAGGKWLDTLVRTQVADASRGAAGAAITVRPRTGYTRMVSPPCCQRCAVLAGKFYRWNTGFQRHPKCDCRHVPTSEGKYEGYTSEIQPGQVKDLTEDQRKAIRDGGDLNQVINAHRKGARSKDGMTTSEGTTRRGAYGARGRKPRLTPEAIYKVSSTREEAIKRLREYGYIL